MSCMHKSTMCIPCSDLCCVVDRADFPIFESQKLTKNKLDLSVHLLIYVEYL